VQPVTCHLPLALFAHHGKGNQIIWNKDMEPEDVIRPLIRAGVKPKLIWAACRTGRLVTEENKKSLTEEDLAEWQAALDEYEKKYPNDDWDMKDLGAAIIREKF